MANALAGLEPKAVWTNFEALCSHPRPSKREDKVAKFLVEWAKSKNLDVKTDEIGNVLMSKPATKGMEDRKAICIQGHMDMVCEKVSGVTIDFDNDPIQPWIDGDWVKAKGTTLGGDDGIAVAMGMALLESTDIPHPALEVFCTRDEETGLTGATHLKPNFLKADVLINLDSEVEGTFTIGCAGGQNTGASYAYKADAVPANAQAFEIDLKGFKGGHSGIEINDGRANTAKLITRMLWELTEKFDIRLSSINSGNKHNAIPREGNAMFTVDKAKANEVKTFLKDFIETLKNEWLSKEPSMSVEFKEAAMPSRVMTKDFQHKMLLSFYAVAHGPARMSPDIKGLVQTSTNFAIVETLENEVHVLTSQRSSVESEKINMTNMVKAAFELGGGKVEIGDGYPAWQPNIHSPILAVAKNVYEKVYGSEPKIEAIHAGLECGLIGDKYPHMDMLSFGPNVFDVHTPDEKLQISSTQRTWNLLLEIVKNMPKK